MMKTALSRIAFAVVISAMAIAAPAQTFKTLVTFTGANGSLPSYEMSLTQGRDGNLYGTTYYGGVYNYGTFFKMTPQGVQTVLHSFDPSAAAPVAGVVLGTDGNFYGTTIEGGEGYGVVYRVTPSGALTVLHSFDITHVDGSTPFGTLVQGTDGNFYGTTEYGGSTVYPCEQAQNGCGTLYKITPTGVLTTLHSFSYGDGNRPWAGLTQATNGDFYGTTSLGGSAGYGTVFQITAAGAFKTLHNFDSTGGVEPSGTLLQGIDGNLYGTTISTIFKIDAKGTFTTIASQGSAAGLTQGSDGNFYGTAGSTLYQLTPGGTLTTLQNVNANIFGDLFQATNGTFYGVTSNGGIGLGTIFSLDMGLGPFVAFPRRAGRVGQATGILGQGFIGTTSVSFNGIPANFTVVSDTFLRATVSAAATTGYVTVTTPSGTLTSNVPFRVFP